MDYTAFAEWFKRLCAAKSKPVNGAQCAGYYEALNHYPESIMEKVFPVLIRDHKGWVDAFIIAETARKIMRDFQAPAAGCDRCHGTTWIEAPDAQHGGLTYSNYVRRCDQCWTLPARRQGAA